MVKLSICIPTYNQVELLRKNIENILQYPGDDIQIVVSDNASEDDIAGMLAEFHDSRIKHCRLPENVGQDRNILNAFRNCDAPYAFLLRTKDTLIPEKIPAIIETVHKYPNVGYWRFACVEQDGKAFGMPPFAVYSRGAEALAAQKKHFWDHPSGEVYHLNFLTDEDFQKISSYLTKYFPEHLEFLSDILLRKTLAIRSEIATSDQYVWVFLTGEAEAKGSTNLGTQRRSVFHPDYQYPRYICEMAYAANALPAEHHLALHRQILNKYCHGITITYLYLNRDKRAQRHYACDQQPFSIMQERKRFYKKTLEIIQNYPPEERRSLKRYALFCLSVMQLRWHASHFLGPLIKEKLMGRLSDIRRKR